MRQTQAIIILSALLFSCGCGLISLMGTPTRYEKEVPAEYDLTKAGEKKLLVLVENPVWSSAPAVLTTKVEAEIRKNLTEKLEIDTEYLIPHETLQKFRANNPGTEMMSPVKLGREIGADLVLLVELHEYSLTKVTETDYYQGHLAGRAAVFGTEGQRLWPESEQGKSIQVAFDVEQGDYQAAIDRLARAFAHCITRYLYNCPVDKFKIFEDKSAALEKWQD